LTALQKKEVNVMKKSFLAANRKLPVTSEDSVFNKHKYGCMLTFTGEATIQKEHQKAQEIADDTDSDN
jgi:hypothetical protein